MQQSLFLLSALCTLAWCMVPQCANAQTEQGGLFEGVLVYHSLENNNKNTIRLSQGIAYNGVRKYEIIVKGNNVHIQDMSMHLHTIINLDKDSVYYYSDAIGRCIRYEAQTYLAEKMSMYSPDYMEVAQSIVITASDTPPEKVRVNDYRIVKTDEKKDFMNFSNDVYRGPIVARTLTTEFEVWANPDFAITPTIRYFLNGIVFDGLPTKYIWDSKGQVPLLGNLSSYSANELKSIQPRTVSDAEFLPPAGYEIITEDRSGFKRIRLAKDNTKYLKKHGQYPTDAEVESDAQYQIDDEWDF